MYSAALVFTGVAFRAGGNLEGVGGNGRTGSVVGSLNVVTVDDVPGTGCVVRVVPRFALPCAGVLELAVAGTGWPWFLCEMLCSSDVIGAFSTSLHGLGD